MSVWRIMMRGPHSGAGLTSSSSTQLTSDGARQSEETQKQRVEAWLIKANWSGIQFMLSRYMYFGFRRSCFQHLKVQGWSCCLFKSNGMWRNTNGNEINLGLKRALFPGYVTRRLVTTSGLLLRWRDGCHQYLIWFLRTPAHFEIGVVVGCIYVAALGKLLRITTWSLPGGCILHFFLLCDIKLCHSEFFVLGLLMFMNNFGSSRCILHCVRVGGC